MRKVSTDNEAIEPGKGKEVLTKNIATGLIHLVNHINTGRNVKVKLGMVIADSPA